MSDRFKVGLSRNRLFEFDNAVVFCGKLTDCDEAVIRKALKLLCLKEPLITAVAGLGEDGDCYVESEAVSCELVLSELTADEMKYQYGLKGVDFSSGLFRFVLSADGYLLIAAHTLVADGKSLLRLAMGLSSLCEHETNSVLPSGVELFSDITALPMEVNSPLTDKLSAELDGNWQKKLSVLGVEDYRCAEKLYAEKRRYSRDVKIVVDSTRTAELKGFCVENNVELSSVVAYAFYKALYDELKPRKKQGKVCVHADRRLFLPCADNVQVGPFNGFCEVSLSEKEKRLSLTEQIKAFHLSCYKGITSPFKTFYDEVLLMKISPSYCDSSYMYLAGAVKDKASRKLAQNYGCMNEQMCEFFSCNLEQEYWAGLKKYSDISVAEPLKSRFAASVSLLMLDGRCEITVKFNNLRLREERCEALVGAVKNILNDIK